MASGFTTLPRALLILWARASTATSGASFTTKPFVVLVTSSKESDREVSGVSSRASTYPSSVFLACSRLTLPAAPSKTVYSMSPRIIPWCTSFRKGSGVGT